MVTAPCETSGDGKFAIILITFVKQINCAELISACECKINVNFSLNIGAATDASTESYTRISP